MSTETRLSIESPYLRRRCPIPPCKVSPATPVGLILKDLGLIHDEARAGGIPLLLGGLAEQRFSEARARGFGEEDMAALVKLWEEPAGVSVSRSAG